jgi:hypothetical protein
MSTSSATIAVNYSSSTMSLSLISNTPTGTVTASLISVSLLPQSNTENQFNLTFQAGSGVSSVIGISVTSVSSTSVSVSSSVSNGVATATCKYSSFPTSAPTASFTLTYRLSSGQIVFHDPTIVFNPPSGIDEMEIEQLPVVAEEVLV